MIVRFTGRVPLRPVPDLFASLPLPDVFARPWLRSFTFSASSMAGHGLQTMKKKKRPRYQDAYANRQAEAAKAANMARQEVLREERKIALGDPIRGTAKTTIFMKSFEVGMDLVDPRVPRFTYKKQPEASTEAAAQTTDTAAQTTETATQASANAVTPTVEEPVQKPDAVAQTIDEAPDEEPPLKRLKPFQLNNFITIRELEKSLQFSKQLSAPFVNPRREVADPQREEEEKKVHEANHEAASEAVSRIMAVEGASSKQLTRINIRRCIYKFGRHSTDRNFPPRTSPVHGELPNKLRTGPDTGSSEVQIAILTVKIRRLADEYKGRAKGDKVNKRNLRLLLHRRQKLLKYFEKKDRGGHRWTHLIETLGLTEATWKGEIAVQ